MVLPMPIASLLLALVVPALQSASAQDTLAMVLAAAERAVQAGRGDSAWAEVSGRAGGAGATRLDSLLAGVLAVGTQRMDAARVLQELVPVDPAQDDPIALAAMTWLAEVHRRAGQTVEAERLWDRGAASAESLGDRGRHSEALVYLSGSALRRGDPAGAMMLLDSAESLIPEGDRVARARAACQRSSALAFTSRHAAADSAARLGARWAEQAGAPRDFGRCLAILGSAQAQRGAFMAAADTLALAADALAATFDGRSLAATLQWRGYALNQLARIGEADRVLREAISLAEGNGDLVTVAWAYLNLGQIAMAFGDRGEAYRAYTGSLGAFEAIGDAWGEHSTLLLRAGVRRDLGLIDQSETDARTVVDWARSIGNADLEFGGWYALVLAAEARGAPTAALALADTAAQVARRVGLGDRIVATRYLTGRILLSMDRPAEAATLLERFLDEVDGSVHARRYAARVRLAEAHVLMGDPAGAGAQLEGAMDDLEAWRASLDVRELRRAIFGAGVDDPDPDLGVATVVDALASSGEVERAFALSERRRARDLADRLEILAATATGDGDPGSRPPHPTPRTPAEILDRLDQTSALVSFATGRGGEPTTAFVLHAGIVTAHRLRPVDSLAAAVARAHALLSSGAPLPAPIARALAAELVDPWIATLPAGVRTLVIVPDDVLHHVPFAFLPSHDGTPIGDRLTVGYTPSASVFVALREREARFDRSSVLAFADPPVPAPAPTLLPGGDGADRRLGPLPGARREVASIRRRLRDVTAYAGTNASESAFKGPQVAGASVIHVASHAVIDARSPLATYVLLAEGGGEDGRLTAAEIEGLRLDADLVVLSACATATGNVRAGEGVEGLTAPLLAAGVRAVVASRWDVEDEATARLMSDFYRSLAAGLNAGDALSAAQRRARERGESATVWAAFSVFGDPLVSPSVRRSDRVRWSVIFGGLLALGPVAFRAGALRRPAGPGTPPHGSKTKLRTSD